MKIVFGVAAAALLLALPAMAQDTPPASTATAAPTQCGAAPTMPDLPEGSTANRSAMVSANAEFTAWVSASQAYLECIRHEADAAAAVYSARRDEYNARRDALRAAVEAWSAETAEFNSRSSSGPSRTR